MQRFLLKEITAVLLVFAMVLTGCPCIDSSSAGTKTVQTHTLAPFSSGGSEITQASDSAQSQVLILDGDEQESGVQALYVGFKSGVLKLFASRVFRTVLLMVLFAFLGLLAACSGGGTKDADDSDNTDTPPDPTNNPKPTQEANNSSDDTSSGVVVAEDVWNNTMSVLNDYRSGAVAESGELQVANIPTWWRMVDPASGYLVHPVWVGGEMSVDTYTTSEAVSYMLMTSYDGYKISNGADAYAERVKLSLQTFANAIEVGGKSNLQMPWLIDTKTLTVGDKMSAADGDALVLATLEQMQADGVFETGAFQGWTLTINGVEYSPESLIAALKKDYVENEVFNANTDGQAPFYVVGVGDGVSDSSWPQATGSDGRNLVMVNTSYNIWVDPAGDETLEEAQINHLRVILASQTWNLDGSDGTRSDVSMGAFPGWTDISGTGDAFSMSSQMTQETVTVDGQEFTFWVLDRSGAGFDLSQERLGAKDLVSFQNYEGHRMLTYAVNMQQQILAKQLKFEETGDPAYALTEAEIEAYSLAEKILHNYMTFQHIVLLTQGEGAMANDAYYITDNDYGDLGSDVNVSTSVPGKAHAYASDTKAGVIAAHLKAAMAVGDTERIALYTKQLQDALSFVSDAYNQAMAEYGADAEPLHIYGLDGSVISWELGSPYFEQVFVAELLDGFPTARMPAADVLQDADAREEAAKEFNLVITGEDAAASNETAGQVALETTPQQGYTDECVAFGDGASLNSDGSVDFTAQWQSVFVLLDKLPGMSEDTRIKSIEVSLSDSAGNPINNKFFLRIQDDQWDSRGIQEVQFENGTAVIYFSNAQGKTLSEAGGTFLNILAAGTVEGVVIDITVNVLGAEEVASASTGSDVAASASGNDFGNIAQCGSLLLGSVSAAGKMFPRGKNVLVMDAKTLARYVARSNYFLSGAGSVLEGEALDNEIAGIVAQIKWQVEAWAFYKIGHDERTSENAFMLSELTEVITDVPQSVLHDLFSRKGKFNLFAVLSPDMILDLVAPFEKCA